MNLLGRKELKSGKWLTYGWTPSGWFVGEIWSETGRDSHIKADTLGGVWQWLEKQGESFK